MRSDVEYANASAFSDIPQAVGPVNAHLPNPLPIDAYLMDSKGVVERQIWVVGVVLDALSHLLANRSREFLILPQSGLCDDECQVADKGR
jgi:hypothetical protein